MGRLKADATPAEKELYREGIDAIWRIALNLMAQEAEHTLTCADEDCNGYIFPWLNEHMRSREEAIVFCTTVLERFADRAADWALLEATVEAGDES